MWAHRFKENVTSILQFSFNFTITNPFESADRGKVLQKSTVSTGTSHMRKLTLRHYASFL